MPFEITRTIKRDTHPNQDQVRTDTVPNRPFRAVLRDVAELVDDNPHLAGHGQLTWSRSKRQCKVRAGRGERSIVYDIAQV